MLKGAARLVVSGSVGPEGSLGKLVLAEHSQRVADTGVKLAGDAIFFSRCLTIAGGTSEILRTLIGERILGLPRESRRA